MNIMKQQIIKLFTNPTKAMKEGLWFSGYKGKGENKRWFDNNQLYKCRWYKNNRLDGEYKEWNENNILVMHRWYEHGQELADFIEHPELKKKYGIK